MGWLVPLAQLRVVHRSPGLGVSGGGGYPGHPLRPGARGETLGAPLALEASGVALAAEKKGREGSWRAPRSAPSTTQHRTPESINRFALLQRWDSVTFFE